MKYAKHLKCLYYIGKCSKYLYFTKKVLCASALIVTALLGISLFSKTNSGNRIFKGLF